MPLHTKQKEPVAAFWYASMGGIALSIVVILLTSILAVGGATCEGDGCALVSPAILAPAAMLILLIVLCYPALYWFLFSYELAEHAITINSGVIFRSYETLDFNRVQVVDLQRGPLLMLFGLTEVRIWTASADQLTFSVGANTATAAPHPDATLLLKKDDAQQLKDVITGGKNSGGL